MWLGAVGLIVFSPLPVDRDAAGTLRKVLAALQHQGLPSWFDYRFVEFWANVAMFMPLGLFLFILAPRGWRWFGPLLALGLSMLIEATQSAALPQRVASPYDVVANTAGALAGTIVAWLLLCIRRYREQRG